MVAKGKSGKNEVRQKLKPSYVGIRLRDIRVIKGLSQDDVTRMAGLRRPTCSHIETGVIQYPRWDTMEKICVALGVSPVVFFKDHGKHLNLDEFPVFNETKELLKKPAFWPFLKLAGDVFTAGIDLDVFKSAVEVILRASNRGNQ